MQKNENSVGMSSILIVAIDVCAWFIGYHTRKSQDNLPDLESVAEMNVDDVNELLVGYRNYQLKDVGGKSDTESESIWIWELDEHTLFHASCNKKDKVVVCSIDAVFQAEIMEIFDNYYLAEL